MGRRRRRKRRSRRKSLALKDPVRERKRRN